MKKENGNSDHHNAQQRRGGLWEFIANAACQYATEHREKRKQHDINEDHLVKWTKWGALGTWAAAGLAFIAAIIFGAQLVEMQKQSALTMSQLRPKLILSVSDRSDPMKIGGYFGWPLTPAWENRGSTDATDFWGWDNGRLFSNVSAATFDFVKPDRKFGTVSKTTLGPNAPQLQQSWVITKDDIQKITSGKGKFVLWGFVEYRDALPGSQLHQIHWCYQVYPFDNGNSYVFSISIYRPECNTRT